MILVQIGDAGGEFVISVTDDGEACGDATSCILCHSDVDGDGVVGVTDLVAVIQNWGCVRPFCTGNVNGDNVVDVQDLLQVILDWGPCP